jgi:hypothetical protein
VSVDRALSRRVRLIVDAQPMRCYANAARAVRLVELEGAVYVEGHAAVWVRHAWIALPDGRTVDPTLPDLSFGHAPVARYERGLVTGALPLTPNARWLETEARLAAVPVPS